MTLDYLLGDLGFDDVCNATAGDPQIRIAIIDSRVDLSHPCFAGAQLRELMPIWLQSVMGPAGSLHGTHIASIIFGQPGSPVQGIAPHCEGVIIPVYGETERGELRACSQEDLARAISLALEAGAHLINISGGELIRPGDVDPFMAQVGRACEQQDVVIIAATGNEGCECLHVPASLPEVLAVGAANASGQPMPFSNWDESLASHGVLAPGEGIRGAVPGNGVALHSGTSFACPIVTGAAALLLSLQKLRGQRPSPKAVRDAIIASAVPCGQDDEEAKCARMLGGRLDIREAYKLLFDGSTVSVPRLRHGVRSNAIRSPPPGLAGTARSRREEEVQSFQNKNTGSVVMTNEQNYVSPQGAAGAEQGAYPQASDAGLVPAQAQAAQPAVAWGADAPHAAGATPPAAAVIGSYQVPPMATTSQPAAVQPQGSCGCRGAQPQQGASPPFQEAAQPSAWPIQPQVTLPYQGAIPMAAPYGVQPALTPAQRTAIIAGYPGSGGVQQMAGRGVAPSQAGCGCPLPNDFISAENSQLIYVIGTLGYDFITDARRDYFVAQLRDMSENEKYIDLFKQQLGLESGVIYYPEDHRAMSAYLNQGRYVVPPMGPHDYIPHPDDIASVVWVLYQENQPLYALRPLHTLAQSVLEQFANFLFDQSRPEIVLGADGKPPKDKQETNKHRADRVAIAGRIIGDITLYNGQRVPVLDVSLRALAQWTTDLLIKDLANDHPEVLNGPGTPLYDALHNFLERVYYEVRNLGQSPMDRAINYTATNIYQLGDIFASAIGEGLELDSIFAEKSPICRPKSDCWDVVMRLFDPKRRLERAVDEYRLTVDVNDIAPVQIGKLRKWARYM